MADKRSEFVLQHDDGTFHVIGKNYANAFGMNTISRTPDIEKAQRFDSYQHAVHVKNNESHLRHTPMKILELRYEIVDCGDVPVVEPDWERFDPIYDREEFARAQSASARRQGQLAHEARQRAM